MKNEDLIKKWLDNDLNANELEAFKKLEEHDRLVKLSDSVKHFKADDYDSNKELNAVLQKINSDSYRNNKSSQYNWVKP